MPSTSAPEVVRRYAVALLDAADESGAVEAVAGDLEGLQTTLAASDELRAFLGDRLIDGQTVANALAAVFEGKIEGLTLNFLRLVAQRRRAHLLAQITDAAVQLLDERAGTVTAEVRTAVELTAQQVERLQERLGNCVGRRVLVQQRVDDRLRGGLVARVGDTVFDGSVESQLDRLRQRLVGAPAAS